MYYASKKVQMIFSLILKDFSLESVKIKHFNFYFNILQSKV